MTGAIIRRVSICAIALGLLIVPHVASAQTGSIKGKVVDAQGTAVEGAEVQIQSLDKGGKPLVVKTKKDGTYMQVGLTPGAYKLTVTKGDLSAGQDNFHVGLDMATKDFTLGAGGGRGGGKEMSKEDVAKAKAKSEAATKAFNDGVAAMNEQKYDDAVAKFQEVIAAVPNCPECYANIGTAQASAKKYDEAEASYKKAIEIKPDMAEAYNGLANLYNAQKKFDQAAEASKKAMELSQAAAGGAGAPGGAAGAAGGGASAGAIYNQGVILWNAGKIPEAKAAFEQAVKLDPNNPDAHYWLGMALVNGGDTKGAKPEFETYLKLAPNGANAAMAKGILDSIK
jgi:tetratricopeptide (TPR) repeat protein